MLLTAGKVAQMIKEKEKNDIPKNKKVSRTFAINKRNHRCRIWCTNNNKFGIYLLIITFLNPNKDCDLYCSFYKAIMENYCNLHLKSNLNKYKKPISTIKLKKHNC